MKFKKSSKLLIEKISKNSLLNKIVEDEILNLFDFWFKNICVCYMYMNVIKLIILYFIKILYYKWMN